MYRLVCINFRPAEDICCSSKARTSAIKITMNVNGTQSGLCFKLLDPNVKI